jgi:uncharacterized protein (TIGR02217 family)
MDLSTIFPVLPGLKWDVAKQPEFSTKIQTSASGKETTAAFWTYPKWTYKLAYELLRDNALNELETLAGFFLSAQGMAHTWLYQDPSDNNVTGQQIGTGTGAQTVFQLCRTFGGFTEPVYNLNGTPTIYVNGTKENLITYSEDLSNAAWVRNDTTLTADSLLAPDGTTTGDFVADTVSNVVHRVYTSSAQTVQAGDYVAVSVYLHSGTHSWAMVGAGSSSGIAAAFNVATGVVGATTSQVVSATMESAGNGWYRCEIVGRSLSSGVPVALVGLTSNTNFAGVSAPAYVGTGGGVYVWGAQVERAAKVSAYKKTTTPAFIPAPTVGATGAVTFTSAPANGAVITADMSYYWRCRFTTDLCEFSQFMQNLWEAKKVEFRTVKQ